MGKEERVEKLNEAADFLSEIDGIEKAKLDDYNPRTADSGVIFATVENDGAKREGKFTDSGKTTYDLTANLRSVSRLIKNRLDDLVDQGVITSYTIVSKPEKQYDDRGNRVRSDLKPIGYDQEWYEIDIWTY